jgi:hypothetical protein
MARAPGRFEKGATSMATVWRTVKGETVDLDGIPEHYTTAELFGGVESCSFCGEASAAWWQGLATITVCRPCAENVLPALLADAVVGERMHLDPGVITSTLTRAERVFWRATALALARVVRVQALTMVTTMSHTSDHDRNGRAEGQG